MDTEDTNIFKKFLVTVTFQSSTYFCFHSTLIYIYIYIYILIKAASSARNATADTRRPRADRRPAEGRKPTAEGLPQACSKSRIRRPPPRPGHGQLNESKERKTANLPVSLLHTLIEYGLPTIHYKREILERIRRPSNRRQSITCPLTCLHAPIHTGVSTHSHPVHWTPTGCGI